MNNVLEKINAVISLKKIWDYFLYWIKFRCDRSCGSIFLNNEKKIQRSILNTCSLLSHVLNLYIIPYKFFVQQEFYYHLEIYCFKLTFSHDSTFNIYPGSALVRNLCNISVSWKTTVICIFSLFLFNLIKPTNRPLKQI